MQRAEGRDWLLLRKPCAPDVRRPWPHARWHVVRSRRVRAAVSGGLVLLALSFVKGILSVGCTVTTVTLEGQPVPGLPNLLRSPLCTVNSDHRHGGLWRVCNGAGVWAGRGRSIYCSGAGQIQRQAAGEVRQAPAWSLQKGTARGELWRGLERHSEHLQRW